MNVPVVVAAIPAIPFYKSPVFIGALTTIISSAVALSPKAAVVLKLLPPGTIETTVSAVGSLVALGAGIWTAAARKRSNLQPITLTQAAADVHPATLAAIAAPSSPLFEVIQS